MNKKTLLLIIIIAIVVEYILIMYVVPKSWIMQLVTFISPITTFISNGAQNIFNAFPEPIRAPLTGIFGAISGSTLVAYLKNKVIRQNADEAQTTESALKTDLLESNSALSTTQTNYEQQISDLKTQIATLTSQQSSTADLQAKVTTLEKQLELAQTQRMEAERLLRVVQNPTFEDIVRIANQQGYKVMKVVE